MLLFEADRTKCTVIVGVPELPACPCRHGVADAQDQDDAALKDRGGVDRIADALRTSTSEGLDAGLGASTLETRVRAFGANRYKQVPQKTFLGLLWGNLQDPIIILLMVAAMVRLAFP